MLWTISGVLLLLLVLMCLLKRAEQTPPEQDTGFDLYVINLDRARKRMSDFVDRLALTDLAHMSPIRFSAIDGRQLKLEEHVTPAALTEVLNAEKLGYRQRHYELTRGAVGCHLSHVAVWQRLLQSDKSMAMVCEDDAVLQADLLRKTKRAIQGMPDDWDILLLGYWCVKCEKEGQHWIRMNRFFGLHCYMIKATAVNKIAAYGGDRIGQQIDSMLSDMCSENRLTVYGTVDKLAAQTGTNSSVQIPLKGLPNVDPWLSLPAVLQRE